MPPPPARLSCTTLSAAVRRRGMPFSEERVPLRGCPFVGMPGLGVEPSGPRCIGLGRCRGCSLPGGEAPLVAERYSVEGFLASGYYADVFRARDLVWGGAVALK